MTRTKEDLMTGPCPEFPQTSADFSGSDDPDLHTIPFPNGLVVRGPPKTNTMATVARWISARLSRLPNTFFEVLPLLLPMGSCQSSVVSGQK